MDQIVTSPDGTLSSMDALNITQDLEKKMSMTQGEKLITKLVKDNWMSEVSILNNSAIVVNIWQSLNNLIHD